MLESGILSAKNPPLMAKELNLDVVVEGVESQSQLDYIRDIDCFVVQGYLLGRPLPAAEIAPLLS